MHQAMERTPLKEQKLVKTKIKSPGHAGQASKLMGETRLKAVFFYCAAYNTSDDFQGSL